MSHYQNHRRFTINTMNMDTILLGLLVILGPYLVEAQTKTIPGNRNPLIQDPELSSTAQQVINKGYMAKDYYLRVQDGNYMVNLVMCTNPLVKGGKSGSDNKDIILFIHGAISSGNIFIVNAEGAKPRDYSFLNASEIGQNDLDTLLEDYPAANSLVYLALDFGHEVWIMNRRPAVQTRSHCHRAFTNRQSNQPVCSDRDDLIKDYGQRRLNYPMDEDYWNFSLDEQAEYDVPETVDFILQRSGRKKLSVVGHSAGGALILMSRILKPELSNKISKTMLWAPAMYLGRGPITPQDSTNSILGALYTKFSEAEPDTFQAKQQMEVNKVICKNTLKRLTTCNTFLGYIGKTRDQEAYETAYDTPDYIDSSSTHELAHLFQTAYWKKMHFYMGNLGLKHTLRSLTPQSYDLSKLDGSPIYVWGAQHDAVVSPTDLDYLVKDLNAIGKVPVKQSMFGDDSVIFQHSSFFTHRNASQVLIIPALIELES